MAQCSRQSDWSSGNHVRQTWCVFSAVCSQPCHTRWHRKTSSGYF